MSDRAHESHHPLPRDDRSRHDLLPEEVEGERATGEDDPGAGEPSATEPPHGRYRNPDGERYES